MAAKAQSAKRKWSVGARAGNCEIIEVEGACSGQPGEAIGIEAASWTEWNDTEVVSPFGYDPAAENA
jgi:hypothetical protein